MSVDRGTRGDILGRGVCMFGSGVKGRASRAFMKKIRCREALFRGLISIEEGMC